MSKERPQTVEELALWAAEHDGWTKAYWESQHKWNAAYEDRMDRYGARLAAAERKIMFYAGGAAALGAVAGTLLSVFIKGD